MLTPGAYLYKYEQNLGLKSVTGEPVPSERHISSVVNKEINANPLSNTWQWCTCRGDNFSIMTS